jgi:AraC family transcriptional regulator
MGKSGLAAVGVLYPERPPVDTMTICTAGSIEIDAVLERGRRIRWKRSPGSIDLLPTDAVCEFATWTGTPTRSIWLSIPKTLPEGDRPNFNVVDDHVVDLVRRLQYQADHQVPLGKAYVEGLTLTLNAYLQARYGVQGAAADLPVSHGRLSRLQCKELRDYIESHLAENISLSDLAAGSGCSVNYFMRLFKQAFDMPPHRYIIERRVERAKALLKLDRSSTIAEIAAACGFSNQAHMQTLFKRVAGMTPGAFRRG